MGWDDFRDFDLLAIEAFQSDHGFFSFRVCENHFEGSHGIQVGSASTFLSGRENFGDLGLGSELSPKGERCFLRGGILEKNLGCCQCVFGGCVFYFVSP